MGNECQSPQGRYLAQLGTGFVQASMSKIQGLLKDFKKPIQQFSRT